MSKWPFPLSTDKTSVPPDAELDAVLDRLNKRPNDSLLETEYLMDDAADAIQSLRQQVARLRLEVDQSGNWQAQTWAMKERAESAEAERDALREDAERYRWLREQEEIPELLASADLATGDKLDAAIDAAMKEGK
jgi:hypothetical protein